jgi:hypothetical protein
MVGRRRTTKMISIGELLKSSKEQQRYGAFIVFQAQLSNSYHSAGYLTTGKILHLGRGSVFAGSVVSICHKAVGRFDANPLIVDWALKTVAEIIEDPGLYKGSYCRRCVAILGI